MTFSKQADVLMMALDEKSRQILTYLLSEQHAGIRELSNLIDASSDMQLLLRIREVINPKAQEIMGKPVATFERSKIDAFTGEKILFHWWINPEFADTFYEDYLVEVMDEKNLLRVVASLPSKEKNVEVTVVDSQLILSGEKYYREVPLPCPVRKSSDKSLRNGVLEVRLSKVR